MSLSVDPIAVPPIELGRTVAEEHPMTLIVAHTPDHVEWYCAGRDSQPLDFMDLPAAVLAQHPTAHLILYDRVDAVGRNMVAPTGLPSGYGWYCLCAPQTAPRLVCAQEIVWQRSRQEVIDGIDCDTGKRIAALPILTVLGPESADAEPFRHDFTARREPWRHRRPHHWTPF